MNTKNLIVYVGIFAIAGLVIGYFIFAKIGGTYVSPLNLLLPSQGVFNKLVGSVAGYAGMRRSILLCGLGGAAAGALAALFGGRRR